LCLQAAVSEFCAASDVVGVLPPPYLQLLAVDLLLQQEQHYQAVQLLYSQPGSGSASLAQHLLEFAGKDGAAAAAAAGVAGVSTSLRGAASGEAVGRMSSCDNASTSPGSAMALELAMDVMARLAVPGMRAAGMATAASGRSGTVAAEASRARAPSSASEALVRQLLNMGQVLQAARVTHAAGGTEAVGVPPTAFLEVAAAAGDVGALAAVYRSMRKQLVETWPTFEDARNYFCGGSSIQGIVSA